MTTHMQHAPDGWQLFFEAGGVDRLVTVEAALAAGETEFKLGARLRSEGVKAAEVAALLTQAGLRRRARSKFGAVASQMLFTQAGLEQASRAAAAELHARRFAAAGCRRVADLGCGIGTESIALLAAQVSVLAVELDALTAQIAEHNLAVAQSDASSHTFDVLNADATTASLSDVDGVFLDPARRTAGHRDTRRLANPDDYAPSLTFAFDLAKRLPTGIKLGPGFERDLIPDNAEAQWVSIDGGLVETGLWFGAVAREGVRRSALVIRGGDTHELTAEADSADVEVGELGSYLYEPDGAVIRARLIGQLAHDHLQADLLSDGIAYLTSQTLVATPFAQAFRVVEQLPASEKHLKRELAKRGIGTLEIKKRGADVDPAGLRTRLRLKGPQSATLFLTRIAGKHTALLAERISP